MNLTDGQIARKYNIEDINTSEEGMREFLFTLGCYPGEKVTLISQMSSNYIINVKDARYSIDKDLASSIEVLDAESGMYYDCHSEAI